MDIARCAFILNTRARGYDEKAKIIQQVANELGREGIRQLAEYTDYTAEELEKYAALPRYFKNKNRSRRQRKPKVWVTKEDLALPSEVSETLKANTALGSNDIYGFKIKICNGGLCTPK